jgi:four helix bundle suffix protein
MPTNNSNFLIPKGDYKNLIAFQKSECIYDITYYFLEHYMPQIGDRTVDQMKQAARSGKQNIAEGNETGSTSMEACIKLVNVAKASLKELQEDYEDYLRNHGNQIWDVNSEKCINARHWCRQHSKTEDYQRVCRLRDDITLANIALILIHQTDYLLKNLLEKFKADFLANGGIKEQMSQARRNWRQEHGMGYLNGNNGKNGNYGKNENDHEINGNDDPTKEPQPTPNQPNN